MDMGISRFLKDKENHQHYAVAVSIATQISILDSVRAEGNGSYTISMFMG